MANGVFHSRQSTCGPQYILKSRFLAIGGLVLIINTLLCIACAILPFWFEFTIAYQYGSESKIRIYVQKWGLFTMDDSSFASVLQMEKVLTGPLLPGYVRVAQILYLLGTCVTGVCAGMAVVLCLYRYGVLAAEMALACVTAGSAISMIAAVVCAFMMTENFDNFSDYKNWNQFPLDEHLVVQKGFPIVREIDWAFGLACVSAILEIVAAVLFFVHACMSCIGIERIRQQQVNRRDKYKPIEEPFVKLRIPPPTVPAQTFYQPTYPSRGFDPTMAVGHEGMVIAENIPARVEPYYRPEPLTTGYPTTPYRPATTASISEEVTI